MNRTAQVVVLLLAILGVATVLVVAMLLALDVGVATPRPTAVVDAPATGVGLPPATAHQSPPLAATAVSPADTATHTPVSATLPPAPTETPPPPPTETPPPPTETPPPPTETPPAPTATTGPAPWLRPGHKYGIHLLLDDGRKHWLPGVWPQHLQAARRLAGEGGYVVQLIRLDDLDVARWQYFMDLCAETHLVPIIRLATPFDHDKKWWEAPPRDPDGRGYRRVAAQFRDFLAQLHWPTTPRYAIVHNEPNRGDEWGNRPDPAEYARYLRDVGDALHQIDVTVLGPALDLYAPHSNGQPINGYVYIDAESFLDGMAAAEPRALDVVDVWAAHAYAPDPFRLDPSRHFFQIDYANGANNPSHLTPPDGIYNRGVNSYRWELWKLEQIAGPAAADLPVMITETGWRHAPSQDAGARDHVHAEISFETMSAYVDLAFHGNGGRYPDLPQTGWTPWNDDPRVLGAVLFALGGYPPDWGHTNWVTLDDRGQVTGFYPITLAR
ncbi:MAG: hypothetical protein PVF47_10795 [Anaerolineae bacterium]